jgi:hypothetical protein
MLRNILRFILGNRSVAAPPTQPPALVPSPTPTPAAPEIRSSGYITTPTGNVPVVLIPATLRGYFYEIVSESAYQDTLRDIWQRQRPERELSLRLVAEPSNSHDPNAVAVQTFAGVTVGYLPRGDAADYQQLVVQWEREGLTGICSAKLLGGTRGRNHIEVLLDIESPTVVATKLNLSYVNVRTQETLPAPSEEPKPKAHHRRPRHATKLSELPIADDSCIDVGLGRGFSVGVVGESHRQSALHDLSNGRRERDEEVDFTAELVLEPENPVDRHAVKVCIKGGAQVGYLSRDDAVHYHIALEALAKSGQRAICRARLVGGTADKPSIGVVLDLRAAHSLAQAIGGDAAF